MTPVEEWFPAWLEAHLMRHPNSNLPASESEEGQTVYSAWVKLFRRHGVHDAEIATEASERLLLAPPRPREHFSRLLDAARDAYRARAARVLADEHRPAPGLAEASVLSAGCPECQGVGWATRRGKWHSMARIFSLALFCRCPAGRWRKAHDPELTRGDQVRQHDDLQARPALWDRRLSFPNWDMRPCVADLDLGADCEGKWCYLWPDDATPVRIPALDGRFSEGGADR